MSQVISRIAAVVVASSVVMAAAMASAAEQDARERKFGAKDAQEAVRWQEGSRKLLFDLMKLSDLVETERKGIDFKVAELQRRPGVGYTGYELEMNSTPTRRMKVVLTVPAGAKNSPAVVCIHGHGGNRNVIYEDGLYRAFAKRLAERGYVTISTDVGQHEVYEAGRTLMGERLWDLMRCVSYLERRGEVDVSRIGCAGLSLGGEMAMWLGAMDRRVKVTVSAGYLTTVANMRQGHCPCWEFAGLTASFDWADIYSLIAPRGLMCQIGQKETAPGGFPVEIAKGAMEEIRTCYAVFGKEGEAVLKVHPEGHVFDWEAGFGFLEKGLQPPPADPR